MTIADATPVVSGATEGTILPEVTKDRASENDCYHSTNDAAAKGAAVASDLKSGMLKTIDACIRTLEARRDYGNDSEAFDAFLKPLEEAKLLSPSEARLRRASPKLSKLCKVGEYADRLRHEQFIGYFLDGAMSGFMLAYQATVLLDQMPEEDSEQTRIGRLVDTLRRKGITTLQGMRGLTKELKANSGEGYAVLESPEPASNGPEITRQRCYDLVVAEPSRQHLRKLDEWYAGNDRLPRCLTTGRLVDDTAVLVVIAPISALPVITDKLLPGCGFLGIRPRVLLTSCPGGPEVTDAMSLIVAERTKNRVRVSDFNWLDHTEPFDVLSVASRIMPDAANTLLLFAPAARDDCYTLIGDANWEVVDV